MRAPLPKSRSSPISFDTSYLVLQRVQIAVYLRLCCKYFTAIVTAVLKTFISPALLHLGQLAKKVYGPSISGFITDNLLTSNTKKLHILSYHIIENMQVIIDLLTHK